MATDPVFASTPRCAFGQVATANTARDGTGTGPATAIWTAPASGSKIEEIDLCAIAATVVGFLRLFIVDGAGANKRLLKEVAVPAITPVIGVTPIWSAQLFFPNLLLPATYFLSASTEVAATFNIFAFGGDF